MINNLKSIINGIDADYADIRYEIKTTNRVTMSKGEIQNAGSNSGDGFVLRVLENSGFSTVSFTRPEDAQTAIKKALDNANLLAENQDKPVKMATSPVVKDSYKHELNEDPRDYSLAEKTDLVRHYSELLYAQPKVTNARFWYTDEIREKLFVNSEGSEIKEELVTTILEGFVTCSDGDKMDEEYFSFGSSNGLGKLRNRDEEVIKAAKIAFDLLNAEQVQSGTYDVILAPSMTGNFVHESFGHVSEANVVKGLPSIREKMQLGTKLGSDILNIVSDVTLPDQISFYKYDDEGTRAKKVNLMSSGVLTGRLHNRITATEFNEPITGHNVAFDYSFEPIIRMGSIFIESGTSTFNELLQQLGDGLYLCSSDGGMTRGENFTFSCRWGHKVENGKITDMIKMCNMTGNLFETLKKITAIGDDLKMDEYGPCMTSQANYKNIFGGPHILIKNVTVGGV
ncbi:MAG: TldD/PmbA family protein [Candidatus Delongbacteria bacterium]|jgi:TldD protein|nr:TldD/PmbA family protein [Candidatus Delongbacteria bacterium]